MDSKQQIISKAADLFMRYGIKSVTMDDLARHLGISKKTLYEHVTNKVDLITQIFEEKAREEKEMMAHIQATSENAIEEITRITRFALKNLRHLSPTTVYDLKKYYRNIWKLMESLHCNDYLEMIKDNLTRGKQQGVYREDMDADIIAKIYVGSHDVVTNEDWFPIQDYRLEELFLQHMTYHLQGILSPLGREFLERYLRNEQQ